MNLGDIHQIVRRAENVCVNVREILKKEGIEDPDTATEQWCNERIQMLRLAQAVQELADKVELMAKILKI